MTHRRDVTSGRWRRSLWRVFTWSNGLRLLGVWGFVTLFLADGEERVVYMVASLALATFGLPGAIRFDRAHQKEKDDV